MLTSKDLPEKARWVYNETLKMNRRAPEMRVASSLSAVEIFTVLYYGGLLQMNPKEPFSASRDRCIISKGHGSVCLFPILADLGFFPMAELERVGQAGSFLGCIPDPKIPGYETINGSLGHGLGVSSGIALALKRKKASEKVFVVTGDGELQEGANWEAFMFASHHKLDNLNVIVDNNHISMLGFTEDAVSHGNLPKRLEAFGWDCLEVDGHDVVALHDALHHMKASANGKPKILLADTLKGHGVPFLENEALAHVMNIRPDVMEKLLGDAK